MSDQVPVERDTKYDISGGNVSGFLKSINADTTPDQILAPAADSPDIQIADLGAGLHTIRRAAVNFGFSQFGTPALVPVNPGVETIIGQGSVGLDGDYFVQAVVDNGAIALPGTVVASVRLRAGTGLITDSIIGNINFQTTTGATVNEFATNVVSYETPLLTTKVISVTVQFDGAAPMSFGCRCTFVYLGAP